MIEEELKDNYCGLIFICDEPRSKECVYRQNKGKCKWWRDWQCTSSVANVNRITLHCKQIGIKLTMEGLPVANMQNSSD
jgi:hypothetical protein